MPASRPRIRSAACLDSLHRVNAAVLHALEHGDDVPKVTPRRHRRQVRPHSAPVPSSSSIVPDLPPVIAADDKEEFMQRARMALMTDGEWATISSTRLFERQQHVDEYNMMTEFQGLFRMASRHLFCGSPPDLRIPVLAQIPPMTDLDTRTSVIDFCIARLDDDGEDMLDAFDNATPNQGTPFDFIQLLPDTCTIRAALGIETQDEPEGSNADDDICEGQYEEEGDVLEEGAMPTAVPIDADLSVTSLVEREKVRMTSMVQRLSKDIRESAKVQDMPLILTDVFEPALISEAMLLPLELLTQSLRRRPQTPVPPPPPVSPLPNFGRRLHRTLSTIRMKTMSVAGRADVQEEQREPMPRSPSRDKPSLFIERTTLLPKRPALRSQTACSWRSDDENSLDEYGGSSRPQSAGYRLETTPYPAPGSQERSLCGPAWPAALKRSPRGRPRLRCIAPAPRRGRLPRHAEIHHHNDRESPCMRCCCCCCKGARCRRGARRLRSPRTMLAASVTARAAALRRRLFVSSPRWTIRRTMSGVVVDCDTGAMIQANGDDRVDVDKDVVAPQSLLSDAALMEHMARGTVVIEPFIPENLSTSSYDVTLGEYYFREATPEPGDGIFNPYSEAMVRRVWGANDLQRAERAGLWMDRTNLKLENVHRDDQLIWIRPGETILGHTNEFIGGRRTVTTMMKARSSLGRNFIEVCKCAGWGDIGYVNRWTMEITNNSRHYSIPLVVGRRIAQIVFFDTQGTLNGRSYSNNGKYQTADTLEALKQKWSPFEMSSSRLGALPERVDQRASSAPFDDRTDKGTGHDRPVKSARRPEHEIVTAAR